MLKWLRNKWRSRSAEMPSVVPKVKSKLGMALYRAEQSKRVITMPAAPTHAKGVVPAGDPTPVVVAMDSFAGNFGINSFAFGDFAPFPGYPYLSMLATRAEYRAMATALATELTREWIQLNSTDTENEGTQTKITEITKYLDDMGLQQIIQRAAEHDAYFGRAQLFIDVDNQKRELPLLISDKTIRKGAKLRVSTVEAIWTTPAGFNALDPASPDFYRPPFWFMLGQRVHRDRLMTVITRPLPDMLKPAFDFGGMSLSQLAEPYVENWLRTRQSVSDLINNYSITALQTNMSAVLTQGDDGDDLFKRADMFTATRANRGLMLLDKETEELVQVNTPLGSLDKLQAQAQEHMCAVSRLPAIILTGLSPTGLNASSEGEIRVFYDWIAAQQEAYWWAPIDTIIKIVQLILYGVIDEDITWSFVPLFQMTAKELSEIRVADATEAQTYVGMGALAPEEVREKLARDPESGYQGLDLGVTITPPDQGGDEDDNDNDK